MKDKKLVRKRIISIVLFIVALCLTELSPFSRHAVSLTNEGYGVLDMTENTIMLTQIYSFPNVNPSLINVCNSITRHKFLFMRGCFYVFSL